jgi:hypothetical protein
VAPRVARRESGPALSGAPRGGAPGVPTLAAILAPALVAVVLCLPRLGLGYFWDDYIFLTNAQASPLTDLLPTPGYPFHRPLSRGAFFDVLLLLGTHGSLAAHAANLVLFAASSALIASLACAFAGPVAGLLAGLAFAAFGPAPGIVAWASGAQDLFAIAFVLAALRLRHAGRTVASAAAFAGALLSKEPAVMFLPSLVLWDWLLGRKPFRIGRHAAIFGGLALLWLAPHPAIRTLASGGLGAGAGSYVGLESPLRWATHLGRYFLTLLNLPITGLGTPWPAALAGPALAAAVLALVGLWLVRARVGQPAPEKPVTIARAAMIAAWIALPQLLLPAVALRIWLPYLACLAAIGSALWIGILLGRAPAAVAAVAFVAYLGLGVWSRGMNVHDEPIWTERTFVEASEAARRLERNWKELRSELPRGAQISLSVATTGRLGISQTMFEGRALRIWYSDSTLVTVLPERHRKSGRPELLGRITSDLSVVEIDPDRIAFRWAGSDSLDPSEIARPIRAYWRGAAASGEVDRAVEGLLRLASQEGKVLSAYDRLLAADLLLAAGRTEGAERILHSTAAFPRTMAVDMVKKLLAETSGNAAQDSSAFPALGLSASDPDVARYMMRALGAEGHERQALHFARRLQDVKPGDMESAEMLRRAWAREGGPPPRVP